MAGMVMGVYFHPEDPLKFLSVWNIKTETAIKEFLTKNKFPYADIDIEKDWQRAAKWVKIQWREKGIRTPKSDAYGLIGGMLENFDFLESANKLGEKKIIWEPIWDMEQNRYVPMRDVDFAFNREFGEEGGQAWKVIKETDDAICYKPLFSRVLVRRTADTHTIGKEAFMAYENFLYIVNEVVAVNESGVPGETRAPEFLSIFDLSPELNYHKRPAGKVPFYRKHGSVLMLLLQKLIRDGKADYQEALAYLQKTFPQVELHKEGLAYTPGEIEAATGDDLWEKFTKGIQKL